MNVPLFLKKEDLSMVDVGKSLEAADQIRTVIRKKIGIPMPG